MSRFCVAALLLASSLAGRALAQSPAPADPPQSSAASPPDSAAKTPAAKKVWTNDDIPSAKGTVSATGNRANPKSTPTPAKTADPGTISRIRQELAKSQDALDEINRRLAAFKDFQSGEPVTAASEEPAKGYTRTPVDQQMALLERKKKKLQDQIDALVDEARKKGIEPGQLR